MHLSVIGTRGPRSVCIRLWQQMSACFSVFLRAGKMLKMENFFIHRKGRLGYVRLGSVSIARIRTNWTLNCGELKVEKLKTGLRGNVWHRWFAKIQPTLFKTSCLKLKYRKTLFTTLLTTGIGIESSTTKQVRIFLDSLCF